MTFIELAPRSTPGVPDVIGMRSQRRRIGRIPSMRSISLDSLMAETAHSIITTFDYVWDRLSSRLAGLSDEEYFWEPVAGCWWLRQGDDGWWRLDGGRGGVRRLSPFPWATIAWRIGHLGGLALGGSPTGASVTETHGREARLSGDLRICWHIPG